MKTKLLTVSVVAMLLLSAFATFPKVFAALPRVYVDPSTINWLAPPHYAGELFNVTIKLEGAADQTEGAQIRMYFNPNVVNVTRWYEPTWDSGYILYGRTTSALPSPPDAGWTTVNPNLAYVQVAVSLFPAYPSQDYGKGAGKICIFTLNITNIPQKMGSLTDTLDIDCVDTYVIIAGDYIGDDAEPSAEMDKTNCAYTLAWATPPSPYMGLDPLTKDFGPDPPSAVGQFWLEKVLIKGLSGAWYLTSASFDLIYNATVIDVIGDALNVTIDPLWLGPNSVTFTRNPDPAVLDIISISVSNPSTNPSGDVLVATIKFTVMMQQTTPPAPSGTFDKSDLTFANVAFADHMGPITPGTHQKGLVRVFALRIIKFPHAEVINPIDGSHDIILGPEPSIGKEFDVHVQYTGPPPECLDAGWRLIGVQFRLIYNATPPTPLLLEGVSITEGPFLRDGPWNKYGTFFVSSFDSNATHKWALVGGMLLPNPETGEWDQCPPWPNGTGTVAIIRFRAIYQSYPLIYSQWLDLDAGLFNQWAIDVNGNYIPFDPPVNGTYKIITALPGRMIDVYGGAVNSGYGAAHGQPYKGIGVVWPAPFGGQGTCGNMDLVIPQSVVYLFAEVTYNYWPVQSKDVGFEIEGPFNETTWDPIKKTGEKLPTYFVRKYSNRTDDQGVAWIKFQMPWPCENPESLFGKYKVTATVEICDIIVIDTLAYDYEYMVEITKVTTDKYEYAHCEYVKVTVDFRSKAQQTYPVLFSVVIQDELETHFGSALIETSVGGAKFCTWKTYRVVTCIHVPKWAFAGIAKIYVSAFEKDPTVGGAPWCPTYGLGWPPSATVPTICIQPW